METFEPRSVAAASPRETKRIPLLVVGIVLFLGSELMFFSSLFGTYYTLRAQNAVWTPPDVKVDALRLLSTSILVASSGTMQMASHRIKQGRVSSMKRWTVLTFFMGAAFLGFQAHEWATVTFTIGTNAYGSTFFAMTGFHGLHVFGGLVLLLIGLALTTGSRPLPRKTPAIESVIYYWHFVDLVWVAMFFTLFVLR